MTGLLVSVIGGTVLLIVVGAILAVAVSRVGHRHEEQVFAVLADLRLHASQLEIRERQALNQIEANTRFIRGLSEREADDHSGDTA